MPLIIPDPLLLSQFEVNITLIFLPELSGHLNFYDLHAI